MIPRLFLFLVALSAIAPAATTVLFDPSSPETGPFPTDYLTLLDPLQKTRLRVDIPVPDCGSQYTSCQEAALIDQLDGFSLRARTRIRFSAPVNTATLKGSVFFVALDDVTNEDGGVHKFGDRIPINQLVYDPATNTLYAKPDLVLDQHRRYALIVTDAVRDTSGAAVVSDSAYQACLQSTTNYCATLASVVSGIVTAPQRIVGASVFTTMSATAWLEHARLILDYIHPATAAQYSFRLPDITSVTLHEQTGTNKFSDLTLPLDATLLSGLDRLVIGTFRSPYMLESDYTIRTIQTQPQITVPNRVEDIGFNALLPSTPRPASGYPVIIFGHGFGDSRFGGPTAVAPTFARNGFAVIAINAFGHGFGAASTVTLVDKSAKSTTLNTLGRSVDVNNDGIIEGNEGCAILTPVAYGLRDCLRQTVVDYLQLVRAIRLGIDLDGDGTPDLDPAKIYYAGESLGTVYGSMFTALEPSIRAAAWNVGGGTIVDIARWSPSYRDLSTDMLRVRVPSLLNKGAGYDEDYVLPDQPVKVTTVPGAIAIQNVFENLEWLGLLGDPIAFAPHVKRPVLVQFARGDQTMPNPATTLLIRAAGLESKTWIYRHDLARAKAPDLPANPHPYLVLFVSLDGSTIQLPSFTGLAISLDAQQQIASWFINDGTAMPDPNIFSRLALGIPVFEIPTKLPQDLGF